MTGMCIHGGNVFIEGNVFELHNIRHLSREQWVNDVATGYTSSSADKMLMSSAVYIYWT